MCTMTENTQRLEMVLYIEGEKKKHEKIETAQKGTQEKNQQTLSHYSMKDPSNMCMTENLQSLEMTFYTAEKKIETTQNGTHE